MSTREQGKIARVYVGADENESHGIPTCQLSIDFGGSAQGFGGLNLPGDHLQAFVRDLCTTFGVSSHKELEGLTCYALRSWPTCGSGPEIVGLEAVSGKRFLTRTWLRERFPERAWPTPLEEKRKAIMADIERKKRQLQEMPLEILELEQEMDLVAKDYLEWE